MKHFYLTLSAVAMLCISSCSHTARQVVSASEELIAVDSTADSVQDSAYLAVLQPKKEQLMEQLNVVIGYAPEDMTVHKPECTMLNWASDALCDMAKQVYSGQVDFAVVNIGGMRCNWQAGDITIRNVYELMPFDNRLVILTLQGKEVLDLCQIYAEQGGQGFSKQMRMQINNVKAQNVRLNGKSISPDAVYYVATSDYLSGGADHFTPLARSIDKTDTGLKIRDLYTQYVEQTKEVRSTIDGRMTLIK